MDDNLVSTCDVNAGGRILRRSVVDGGMGNRWDEMIDALPLNKSEMGCPRVEDVPPLRAERGHLVTLKLIKHKSRTHIPHRKGVEEVPCICVEWLSLTEHQTGREMAYGRQS